MPASGNPFVTPETRRTASRTPRKPYAGNPIPFRSPRGINRVGTREFSEISMGRATLLSSGLHVVTPVVLALLVLAFVMLGLRPWEWFQPKTKPALTFTLVRDTNADAPENPLFKGQHNQQAGGRSDPTQPIKAVEQQGRPEAQTVSEAAKKSPSPGQQATTAQPQPEQTKPTPKQQGQLAAKAAPKTETAKPKQATGAEAASDSTRLASASPLLGRTGDTGNPQTGKNPEPGVDVVQDIDYGPFMAELERRIRRNWVPPRGQESRRVTLLFYLARDGRVLKVTVKEPSGSTEADEAAIQSVHDSAPFMAFPPEVREDVLPVEFSFDYNVLNPSRGKRATR